MAMNHWSKHTQRWIDVRYKCGCQDAERTVQVQERRTGEDVLDFMRRVQLAIGADHRKTSPLCMSNTMEYAKVPAPGDRIGGAEGGTA